MPTERGAGCQHLDFADKVPASFIEEQCANKILPGVLAAGRRPGIGEEREGGGLLLSPPLPQPPPLPLKPFVNI